jgi:hypothetical protein
MQDTFIVATERDIHTGDSVEIRVITKVCLWWTRIYNSQIHGNNTSSRC